MSHSQDVAAAALHPRVQALRFSALGQDDLINLILQRSEVLFDVPQAGKVIRAWNMGDMAPILDQVDRLGLDVARRAAGVILEEYLALEPLLRQLAPRRVADIGCGYALFDLFLLQDQPTAALLIDIESNERRHFGFAQEGAAYSSLAVAKALLFDNGIAPVRVQTVNPKEHDPADAGPVDLVFSFLSCGFHYPVDTYMDYFARALMPGGHLLLDLRETDAAPQLQRLSTLGKISDQPAPPKVRRVLVQMGTV
ncbi:class I SAM-dependent methyltransferase [Phaeovulum sp.]|uniref:class I SAM-dependent methyltransferase n=1 Tax=Phaeovulum sp. TaxID=2934796 RepID=UPI0035675676